MKSTRFRWVIRTLALCLMLLAALSTQALAAYSGTPETPTQINSSTYAALGLTSENWNQYNGYYGIRNAEELYGFAALVNGGHTTAKAVLLQDIVVNETLNASAHAWTPIGTSLNIHFKGAFDGNGHTISGLYYNDPNATYVGLFGVVGFDATNVSISNVTLANSYLRGSSFVGGIAGFLVGENVHIDGCKIAQDVTVCATTDDERAYLGGISGGTSSAGEIYLRTVQNCVVLGSVVRENAGNYAGALVGHYPVDATATIKVENCYYRTGCLTVNNETKNFGNGSVFNYSNDTGCTRLTSASDSHNCLSVSSAETRANCTYPGRSAHSFCLICGTVTNGTRTVTPVNSTAHLYSHSDCLTDGVCQVCSHNKGKDPDNHQSSETTYSPSATNPRKHDILHKCCNAPTGETGMHEYEGFICKLCNAVCPHDSLTGNVCNDCGQTGDPYIYYEWADGQLTQKQGIAPASAYNNASVLNSGWYIVEGTKTVNSRIMIKGDVHLILADGAHLNAPLGIELHKDNSLHIYAQSTSLETAGRLTVDRALSGAGIGGSNCQPPSGLNLPSFDVNAGDLTIHGGVISAAGHMTGIGASSGLNGAPNGFGGNVIIFGGQVTAKGGYTGYTAAGIGSVGGLGTNAGTVTVHGGTVKAEGTGSATGIGCAQAQGAGANVVITGGSVWAIAGEASMKLKPIGGSQQSPNDYTLRNANGDDLSLYTLVLEDAADSAQVNAISGTAAASYGISDIYTQNGGKLYFYLPKDTDITLAVSSVTAGGKTYRYSETSESGEHLYVPHAHSWTFSLNESKDAIVAVCSGSGTCSAANSTVAIQLTAPENLTYDGQAKTATVQQTPAGVFTSLPSVSYCCAGGCIHAGEHTASLFYGGVTVQKKFIIAPLDITGATVGTFAPMTYDGSAQMPEAPVTLGGLTVTGTWSRVTNVSDKTTFTASGNFTSTIADQASGMIKAIPTAEDFAFAPPAHLVYDGHEKSASITALHNGMGSISISYFRMGETVPVTPIEGGEYRAVIDVTEGENYAPAASLQSNNWKFAISQAQTALTARTDRTVYTYGDIITVTGTAAAPQRTGLLRLFASPSERQVALYDAAGTQLTAPVDVVNGEYILTYNTADKGIGPDELIQLMVEFVGDSSLSGQTAPTNTFTLSPKKLTPILTGSAGKPYDGTTAVAAGSSLALNVSGVLGSDHVVLSGSYAYDNADAGTGKTIYARSLTLTGTDEPFYTLSADTASAAAGEITKAQIAPGNGLLSVANNQKKTYAYDLSQLLPSLDGSKTFGSASYQLGAISLGSYYADGASISGSVLNLPIEAQRGSGADVGTVTITVTSTNYDFTADAVITVKQGAQIPEIEEQPASASYLQGERNAHLKVKAKITDGGKLTYQWYSNTVNSNDGGSPISGADGANYKPSTEVVGTVYYYCVVTNTNGNAAGQQTVSIASRAATVTVLPAAVAHDVDITIIGHPGARYDNVHAKLMPLGSTAPLHDRVLPAIANTAPVQYLYHETAADGRYNLVITAEEASSHKTVTLTTLINLQGHDDRHDARLPEAEKSSIVVDNSELGIIAGNVEEVAAGQMLADPQGHLEVTLTTEQGYDPQTAMTDAPMIKLQASEDRKQIEVELDIDLTLHQFDANGSETSQANLGSSNTLHLEILIPVKTAGRAPEGFAVYRVHNGELHKLPYGAGDEYFTVDIGGGFIKLYVKRFSSYAVGYGEPAPQFLPAPPQTGDPADLTLWLALTGMSLAGMMIVFHLRKRKEF